MNLFRRGTGRFGRLFLAAAAASALLSIPSAALGTLPVAESFFATVPQPIGVAASPGKLLVTQPYCNGVVNNVLQPRRVVSIDPAGVVRPFATLPSPPEGICREEYIAIAPAAADFLNTGAVSDPLVPNRKFTPNESGFASGFVYVTQGATIIKIAPDGSAQTPFTTLSPCGDTHTGVTFDRTGGFGYRLIAVCNTGNVWAVDKLGHASPIGTGIEGAGPFEGPDVAPNGGFSPFNGQLLVAVENPGQVVAVSSAGTTRPVAAIDSAEGVAVIPSTVCSFGSSGGAYFSAVFGNDSISKVAKTAFTGLSGALVRREGAETMLLSSDGTTLNTTPTTFSTLRTQHEGASFCVDSVPTDITGFIRREPGDPINPKANGVITVTFFPIPGIFDPFTVTDFRAGITGTEKSLKNCEREPEERGARVCKFFKDKLGITGGGVYRGLLHFIVIYKGKEGGSDAGGCG